MKSGDKVYRLVSDGNYPPTYTVEEGVVVKRLLRVIHVTFNGKQESYKRTGCQLLIDKADAERIAASRTESEKQRYEDARERDRRYAERVKSSVNYFNSIGGQIRHEQDGDTAVFDVDFINEKGLRVRGTLIRRIRGDHETSYASWFSFKEGNPISTSFSHGNEQEDIEEFIYRVNTVGH